MESNHFYVSPFYPFGFYLDPVDFPDEKKGHIPAQDGTLRDCDPHRYHDSFCEERGKARGARLRANIPPVYEGHRSMGCERSSASSPSGAQSHRHASDTPVSADGQQSVFYHIF